METIPNTAKINVIHYQPAFSAFCSVGLSPFTGTIEIIYEPADSLLEFESFETWLRGTVSKQQLTIEDLTRLVFDTLTGLLGEIPLSVTIHAETIVHAPVSATIQR